MNPTQSRKGFPLGSLLLCILLLFLLHWFHANCLTRHKLPAEADQTAQRDPYVVAYFPHYTQEAADFLNRLDASLLSHLVYAFADIGEDGSLSLPDPEQDEENLAQMRRLRQQYGTNILLSVGGTDSNLTFRPAVGPELRDRFAQSCVEMVFQHDLDGIDLDWEHPQDPEAVEDYILFLAELRRQLDQLSGITEKTYWITAACSKNILNADPASLRRIAPYTDYIFLMCYDLYGGWNSRTNFNAPLFPAEEAGTSVYHHVTQCLDSGVPASKLVLGMPFYGRAFEDIGGGQDGLGASFEDAWELGYDAVRKNYFSDPDFQRFYHPQAQVPWLCDGETFVCYEDVRSLSAKAELVNSLELAGAGVWALPHDSGGSLLAAIWAALHADP